MIGRTQLSKVEENTEEQSAPSSLHKVADEMEIRRIVDEIDNAVDAKDWMRARTFFADKIEVDFTSLTGGEPARITADELIGAGVKIFTKIKKAFTSEEITELKLTAIKRMFFPKDMRLI
jgi:hypothetical protein